MKGTVTFKSLILEENFNIHDYKVCEENTIRIYSNLEDIEKINYVFCQKGVLVSKLCLNQDTLEDYFLKLTVGDKHA